MKLDLRLLLFQLQSTAPSNIPDDEGNAPRPIERRLDWVWGNATRDNFSGPRDNFSGPRGTVLPPVFAIHNQADVIEHKDNQLPKYEDLFPSTQININTEMK